MFPVKLQPWKKTATFKKTCKVEQKLQASLGFTTSLASSDSTSVFLWPKHESRKHHSCKILLANSHASLLPLSPVFHSRFQRGSASWGTIWSIRSRPPRWRYGGQSSIRKIWRVSCLFLTFFLLHFNACSSPSLRVSWYFSDPCLVLTVLCIHGSRTFDFRRPFFAANCQLAAFVYYTLFTWNFQ